MNDRARGRKTAPAYTYDPLNRLTDIVNRDGNNDIVSYYHYLLRADGKRSSVTDASGITNYTYDNQGKLTQEAGPYATIAYTYDNVGNRLTRTVTNAATGNGTTLFNGITNTAYDQNDRIVGHTYDANGSETTVNGQTASYDFENHLVSLGSVASYVYDADGNRYSAASLGTTTSYTVDTSLPYASVVEEYSNGTLAARYDYGDDLVRMDRGSGVYYYLYDGLGSTRQLVNTAGAVTDTWGYSAFGELASHTGSTVNPFLFNAQQFDGASGNYYLRARYYDQSAGRFISQDPYSGSNSDPISLHRYLYASGNPVGRTDPTGQADMGELVEVNALQSFLMSSFRFALANSRLAAYRVLQAYYTNAAAQFAINFGASVVLTTAGNILSNIVASRPDGQWSVANRPDNSVWNMGNTQERGRILENQVLGRPATISGVSQYNFGTIDDFNNGVATSIKSVDLTAPYYNNSVSGAANLTGKLDLYASQLSNFQGDRQFAGGTTLISVTPDDISASELRIAIEPGATSTAQATAINEWLSTSQARFPNINVIIQEVEMSVPTAIEEAHE